MKHFLWLVCFFISACQGSLQDTIKNHVAYEGGKSKYSVDRIMDLNPIDYKTFEMPAHFVKMQEEEKAEQGAQMGLTCLVAKFLDEKEIVYWMHGLSLLFPSSKSTFMVIHPFSEETFFSTAPALAGDSSLAVEGTEYGVKIKKGDAHVHLLFSRYWSAGFDQLHLKHVSGHGEGQENVRRPLGSDHTAPLYYYESELFPRSKIKLSKCELFFPHAYKELLKWTMDTWSVPTSLFDHRQIVPHEKKSSNYLYKRATSK